MPDQAPSMGTRRHALRMLGAAGACALLRPVMAHAQPRTILSRPIPSTGERMPVVGLGTWIGLAVGSLAKIALLFAMLGVFVTSYLLD